MKKSLLLLALLAGTSPVMAATYTQAQFAGAVSGGNANAKAPFDTVGITQGLPFSGSFVVQDGIVPATGAANIAFSSFTDFAGIPTADLFQLNIGSYSFSLADNLDALSAVSLQYNNGQLIGFVFNTDVFVQGNWYLFAARDGKISVKKLDNVATAYNPHGSITGSSFVNASFTPGATNAAAYVIGGPAPAVPEPTTWALMIAGLGVVGMSMRRRKVAVAFA